MKELLEVLKDLSTKEESRHDMIREVFAEHPQLRDDLIDLDKRIQAAEIDAKSVIGDEATQEQMWEWMIRNRLTYYDCIIAAQSNLPLQAGFIRKAEKILEEQGNDNAETQEEDDAEWFPVSGGQWGDLSFDLSDINDQGDNSSGDDDNTDQDK